MQLATEHGLPQQAARLFVKGSADVRVSCLMVTLASPARLPGMMRAIAAWRAQTHSDRELIVMFDPPGGAAQAEAVAAITALDDPAIRTLFADRRLSLGMLRNLAVERATGEVVCQWDDDDLYHPDRIAAQLAAATGAGKPATVLQDVMMYDPGRRSLRWTNWAATPAGGHPGTLLCRRDAMPRYPDAALGEDLVVLERLRDGGALHLQPGAPQLYIYVTHGANSTSADHRAMLAEDLAISSGLLRRRETMLRDALAPFDFGAAPVRVEGSNGAAFTL